MTMNASDSATTGRAWVVPACSVAFAVLFVAGLMFGAGIDTEDKTAEQILKTFNDQKTPAIVSAYLLVLAGLAFLPVVWAATRQVSAGLSAMGEQVARSAALLFVAMMLVAGVIFASLAGAVTFGSEKDPPVDLIRFIPQIGFGMLLIAGALCVGLFLVVVSRAGQTTGSVPTWFWVLGYVAAVAMLAGPFFIPMILLPIWAIAAAFVLRPRPA